VEVAAVMVEQLVHIPVMVVATVEQVQQVQVAPVVILELAVLVLGGTKAQHKMDQVAAEAAENSIGTYKTDGMKLALAEVVLVY
jgi:hypothetical protein